MVLLMGGCAYPIQEKYHDFLLDLDVINRFDLCIDRIEKNKAGLYIKHELQTLLLDIDSWTGGGDTIGWANQYLSQCGRDLLDSIDQTDQGNEKQAAEKYNSATHAYTEAKRYIRKNNAEVIDVG